MVRQFANFQWHSHWGGSIAAPSTQLPSDGNIVSPEDVPAHAYAAHHRYATTFCCSGL